VIQMVDRFEAEHQWRIPVLLEDHGREQHRFETVRAPMADDAPETAERGAAARLVVVGQPVEEVLNRCRRVEPRDEATFLGCEFGHLVISLSWHFEMTK
jgi:hypothetical protein